MIPTTLYGAYLHGYLCAADDLPCQLNPYWPLVQPARHAVWDEGHRDCCGDVRARRVKAEPALWMQFDDEQLAALGRIA